MRGLVAAGLLLTACGGDSPPLAEAGTVSSSAPAAASIDAVAAHFVKLTLAVGKHDPNFVDAYHGPAEWADAAAAEERSLSDLEADAIALSDLLGEAASGDARSVMLGAQIEAALTRIRMAQGARFTFDQETRLLYDAEAPNYDIAEFDRALARIEALVPGEGQLAERVDAFRNSVAIPEDRLRTVFDAAIAECRRRTADRIALPEGETFELEFVSDKPWSAYNWYQGDFRSRIQVNTDLPIFIDRAIELGCHEGYPGHHVWHSLIDRDLLKGEGWIEYAVYPLFSPMSLISEGSANYGVDLAFPEDEKLAFERDVLFPLAGLDPASAGRFAALNEELRTLSHADNHAAREYLEGRMNREAAIDFLMRYKLTSRERAEQRVRFIETYRGYVINYNLGRDLVAAHIEASAHSPAERWDAFAALLSSPVSASRLQPSP